MSVYDKSGNALTAIYGKNGEQLQFAYDKNGTEIFSGTTPDYDEYSTEYQHSILTARNAWSTEYRADNDVIPLVLTTDQHGFLNANTGYKTHGQALYNYLALAVKWAEVSASLNLGDVCPSTYNETELTGMQLSLANIPSNKQINVAGNHDVQGICDDDDAMNTMFDTFFNNSNYNGNSRFQHRGFETMIDVAHGIRYVCIGSWDFTDGVYNHYNISTASLAWLIDTLETADNYDVIILSHVQPSVGNFNCYYPAVDGKTFRVKFQSNIKGTSAVGFNTPVNEILYARKNKTSGTITDSSGVEHNYDFSSCTSDIICSLHGHSHVDWYNYVSGFPSITFDAYRYDDAPFFFVDIDKDNEKVDVWKVGESGQIQTYSVLFTEHVNPCTGIALDQHTLTIAVGESATLAPTFTTQYPDDGTYPQWVATWSVRVGSALSSSVASVDNGVVTGNSEGTCTVYAYCGSLVDTCTVTVTE